MEQKPNSSKKVELRSVKPNLNKTNVISCCVEYNEKKSGESLEVKCEKKANFMVKSGSYNSKKVVPMCRKHRDIYKARVEKAKKLYNMELVYEESSLQ